MTYDPAPPTRHLRVRLDRGHTVLEFHGEIDIVAALEITPYLDAVTGHPEPRIVIDLRPVEFFELLRATSAVPRQEPRSEPGRPAAPGLHPAADAARPQGDRPGPAPAALGVAGRGAGAAGRPRRARYDRRRPDSPTSAGSPSLTAGSW